MDCLDRKHNEFKSGPSVFNADSKKRQEQNFMVVKKLVDFKKTYMKLSNRLVREFSIDFCRDDGSIDWEKLTGFNSGE